MEWFSLHPERPGSTRSLSMCRDTKSVDSTALTRRHYDSTESQPSSISRDNVFSSSEILIDEAAIDTVNIYHRPQETLAEDTSNFLFAGRQRTMIMGDFNCKSTLLWSQPDSDENGDRLAATMEEHDCVQYSTHTPSGRDTLMSFVTPDKRTEQTVNITHHGQRPPNRPHP